MNQYENIDEKLAGLKFGMNESKDQSYICKSTAGIQFGSPVFGYIGYDAEAHNGHSDQDTGTFDATFIADNVINGEVNGNAISAVTFLDDQATTMALLIAEIEALEGVTLVELESAQVIRIVTRGIDITSDFTVTLGSSQAVYSAVTAIADEQIYIGSSRREMKVGAGTAQYDEYDMVNVMEEGELYVVTDGAVNFGEAVYATLNGTYSNSSSGNILTNGRFKETLSAAGLARIDVGGMKV